MREPVRFSLLALILKKWSHAILILFYWRVLNSRVWNHKGFFNKRNKIE